MDTDAYARTRIASHARAWGTLYLSADGRLWRYDTRHALRMLVVFDGLGPGIEYAYTLWRMPIIGDPYANTERMRPVSNLSALEFVLLYHHSTVPLVWVKD